MPEATNERAHQSKARRGVATPEHSVADHPGATEVIDNGLTWDHQAGTVLVRRLPWMSDRQWLFVRERMIAFLEAEGLIRDDEPAGAAR